MKLAVTYQTTFTVGDLRKEIRRGLILRMTKDNAQNYNIGCQGSEILSNGVNIYDLPFDKTNTINLFIGTLDDFAIG